MDVEEVMGPVLRLADRDCSPLARTSPFLFKHLPQTNSFTLALLDVSLARNIGNGYRYLPFRWLGVTTAVMVTPATRSARDQRSEKASGSMTFPTQ